MTVNRNMWILVAVIAGTVFLGSLIHKVTTHISGAPEASVTIPSPVVPKPQQESITEVKTIKKTIYSLPLDPARTLFLNSEVDYQAVDLIIEKIQVLNTQNHDPIVLLLDSPGGSVFDGARLISFMEASPSPVITVVVGLCASMCANIEEHGAKRLMVDRTILMFHPAAGGLQGQVDEMNSLLSFLIHEVNKLDAYTADRSQLDRQLFKNMLLKQLWVSADDALALHLIDNIVTISIDASSNDKVFNLRKSLPDGPDVINALDKLRDFK